MTTYWSAVKDSERIRHTSSDDAIEDFLGCIHPDAWDALEVYAREYTRMKPKCGVHGVLSTVLEQLDEEYADPDGEGTHPTPAMIAAAEAFVQAVLAEYQAYYLEPTGTVVRVNALEWVKEHRPGWLESKP